MRSKGALAILVLLILVGLGGCYGCTAYNGLVASDEAVTKAWADVENQYQRRVDLVPQLIQVVESAASIDESLIKALEESAEAVEHTRVNNLRDEESLRLFAERQMELGSRLASMTQAIRNADGMGSIEAHRDLLVQMEGTENRIAVARRNYNEVVGEYNRDVRGFPRNMIAGLFGFDPRQAFSAEIK